MSVRKVVENALILHTEKPPSDQAVVCSCHGWLASTQLPIGTSLLVVLPNAETLLNPWPQIWPWQWGRPSPPALTGLKQNFRRGKPCFHPANSYYHKGRAVSIPHTRKRQK